MKRLFLPLPILLAAAACNSGGTGGAAAAPSTPAKPAAEAPKAATAPAPGAGDVVATIGDEKITMADLDQAAGRELFEIRERTLDELVTRKVLEGAAKKAGKTVDAFIQAELEKRVPNVSDAEAEAFFTQNGQQIPQFAGKSFAEVKDQLVGGLTDQKRREAAGAFLGELRNQAGVKVLLEAPRVEVAATGPSKGPEGAPVTIVEFSDFECPYCSRGRDVLDQVTKTYGDKVRVVFRDFPLQFHANAQKAAEAGHCADEQGKFWELHDWMFANQRALQPADLGGAAATLGLDRAKFDECLTSGRHAQRVAQNMADGQKAGVSGTPAFFVNGVMINGAQPFEKFKEVIDRELARKGG